MSGRSKAKTEAHRRKRSGLHGRAATSPVRHSLRSAAPEPGPASHPGERPPNLWATLDETANPLPAAASVAGSDYRSNLSFSEPNLWATFAETADPPPAAASVAGSASQGESAPEAEGAAADVAEAVLRGDEDRTECGNDLAAAERGRLLTARQMEKMRQLVGGRLRVARELSEIQQIEAAQAVGYKAATQLNEAEFGKRMLALPKLVQLARLYAVSLDYLFGATDDPCADPYDRMRQQVVASVCGRFDMLAHVLASANIEAVRAMGPDAAETLRLAEQAQEIELALLTVRKLNPGMDDEARGLASLVMKVQAHADSGRHVIERHRRVHLLRAQKVREVDREVFEALGADHRASLLVTAEPHGLAGDPLAR